MDKEEGLTKEIQVLKLEPGDALVIMTERVLSQKACENVIRNTKEALRAMGKEGTVVIILDGGMGLEKLTIPKESIISIVEESIRRGGRLREVVKETMFTSR